MYSPVHASRGHGNKVHVAGASTSSGGWKSETTGSSSRHRVLLPLGTLVSCQLCRIGVHLRDLPSSESPFRNALSPKTVVVIGP